MLHEEEEEEEEAGDSKEDTTHTHTPALHDVVALVEESSTRNAPKIILGKVLR